MKVQDYVLSEDYSFWRGSDQKTITIPAGTFVKPIHHYYLPAHIKDSWEYKTFNPELKTYIYCSFGMFTVPRNIVREK